MGDNEHQIYNRRRRNSYLSFNLMVLIPLLIFLELSVVVPNVRATNQCTEFQFLVRNTDGTTSCEDCEHCPPGRGLSHECGTEISGDTMIHCIPCSEGRSFSTKYDTSSCILCSASCSEDQLVNQTCTTTSDVKCAKQCNSKDRYYDEVIGDCKRCSKCCGDAQDVIEEECKSKMGASSNMICSFQSSVNRCDRDTDTLTPSPQETRASQTEANASASPENTTESKNASTAASLNKTTASQKDRATEFPKVTTVVQSTPFPAHFTQNVTGTFISSGDIRSLQDSSKAKLADNQVGLIVGITVGVVLVLVISGALISYCLLSKLYSCSKDPEKGVYNSVNDTEPCPVAIKGDPHTREKKPWKVKWTQSKSESIDPLCEKNPEGLVCARQTSTQKEPKLLESLLSQESTLQAVCERLDTFVRLGGDYRAVAKYYGFNYYQISSVLGQATYPGEPTKTRALIVSLASSRPNLTVKEFATVVEEKAKRKDVSRLLRAYDMAEEATEEE